MHTCKVFENSSTRIELVLLCLLIAFVALFIVWKKRRVAIFFVTGFVFWLLGSWLAGPLIQAAQVGQYAMLTPRIAPRTAIIVLGGGTAYDSEHRLVPKDDAGTRITLAGELYKRCVAEGKSCKVIMSGGNPQHHERSEAEVYAPLLIDAGVSRDDLIVEDQSLDTYENARNTYKILRSRQYDTTILITSSLHMNRALLSFEAFDIHPQPAVAYLRHPKSWWVPHPEGWIDSNSALHEIIGDARFYVWRWIGLY
jgi:uncharacterized SAM-binding protein YcdF (DUF218 family)